MRCRRTALLLLLLVVLLAAAAADTAAGLVCPAGHALKKVHVPVAMQKERQHMHAAKFSDVSRQLSLDQPCEHHEQGAGPLSDCVLHGLTAAV